ncbi:MAG TPA: tRNA (adenosine(37)-N6)-threonylcarbamoyltransferase complex transferase subunit TsaD [Clostridiales bacterium]|nr:tRNA (adenosine(37)-N6)-threonylcarbamoyltransferase complex transferase subunit TsaD [Clostridiales bacterium]
MKILAIETSCDETAAAVVEDGRKVLSNIVATQIPEHIKYGGVVPEIASRSHCENIVSVVTAAMRKAAVDFENIDAIAVTAYPGLIGALLVGVNYAKGLSISTALPLVPVHHLRAHVASNYISNLDVKPPFLALIVSGGHTHLCKVSDYTSFEILGRTRDDAAGEALDKAARAMGLAYPGGANLDKLAVDGDDMAYTFPHPRVDGAPLDFSFSGLKTSVVNLLHNSSQKGETLDNKDLGASYIKAIVDSLIKNTALALDESGLDTLVVAGGVAANSVLRKRLEKLGKEKNIKVYIPELRYCGDNAAMVGSQGYYEFLSGNIAGLDLNAKATMDI